MPPKIETERTRLRRERRERERFLKHAVHFLVRSDVEARDIKIALERQFPGIDVLTFKGESHPASSPSVAYQPGEGQRALTCFPVGDILVLGVWMLATHCPKHAVSGRTVLPGCSNGSARGPQP